MSLLSLSFPLSHLGDPRAGRWRDLKHDLLSHCRRKCGRCPFTLAANRAYLPLQAGKGMQAPLARFSWRPASIDERAAAVFVDMDAHDFVERVSALKPSSRARRASMRCGQPATMRATNGSWAGRMRAATRSPAMRRSDAICSATVQQTPGIDRLTRGP